MDFGRPNHKPVKAYSLQNNPRNVDHGPGITAVKTPPRNSTHEESEHVLQRATGLLLVPYGWFLKLKQPTAQELFRDPEHMRVLGCITRLPDQKNSIPCC